MRLSEKLLKIAPIPTVVSQNVKRSLVRVESEKFVSWISLKPLVSMRLGEAELGILFD